MLSCSRCTCVFPCRLCFPPGQCLAAQSAACCPLLSLLCLGLWDEDVLLSWCHHQGGVWHVRRAVRDAGQCSSCWRWCSFVSRCEICVLPSVLCIFSSHFPLPSPQIPPEGHVFGTWCCLVAAGCTVLLVPGDLAPCAGVRWQAPGEAAVRAVGGCSCSLLLASVPCCPCLGALWGRHRSLGCPLAMELCCWCPALAVPFGAVRHHHGVPCLDFCSAPSSPVGESRRVASGQNGVLVLGGVSGVIASWWGKWGCVGEPSLAPFSLLGPLWMGMSLEEGKGEAASAGGEREGSSMQGEQRLLELFPPGHKGEGKGREQGRAELSWAGLSPCPWSSCRAIYSPLSFPVSPVNCPYYLCTPEPLQVEQGAS